MRGETKFQRAKNFQICKNSIFVASNVVVFIIVVVVVVVIVVGLIDVASQLGKASHSSCCCCCCFNCYCEQHELCKTNHIFDLSTMYVCVYVYVYCV